MQTHCIAYLIGGGCIFIGLANGTVIHFGEGGLLLTGIAADLAKIGAVISIGGWFLELAQMYRKLARR